MIVDIVDKYLTDDNNPIKNLRLKYLFKKKFLVVWKYAQMHQKTFLTTPDGKKYLN